MSPNPCKTAGAIGVVASLLVAAGLGASLYVTTKTTSSVNATAETTTGSAGTTSSGNVNLCGYCGPEIAVTLRVENGLIQSFFNHSVELNKPQRELIFFLQEAALKKEQFRFSASFQTYGFMINTMNGLTANWTLDKSWWRIADGNDDSLPLGVSSYVPKDGETIVFSYTRSSGH